MTKEQWKERLEIIEGWLDGETAQVSVGEEWKSLPEFKGHLHGILLNPNETVRIKPKQQEWWVLVPPMMDGCWNARICDSEVHARNLASLEIYKGWTVKKAREVVE